jgi:DNA-binding CsgD family transcriptional regulator
MERKTLKSKEPIAQFVKENYEKLGRNACAAALGMNPQACAYWAKKLGILPKKPNKLINRSLIIKEYTDNKLNAKQIANKLGLSYYMVTKVLRSNGVMRASKNRDVSLKGEVKNLAARGLSLPEIAATLHRPKSTIFNVFIDLGIKPIQKKRRAAKHPTFKKTFAEEVLDRHWSGERFERGTREYVVAKRYCIINY